jgi:hypothetical protein
MNTPTSTARSVTRTQHGQTIRRIQHSAHEIELVNIAGNATSAPAAVLIVSGNNARFRLAMTPTLLSLLARFTSECAMQLDTEIMHTAERSKQC